MKVRRFLTLVSAVAVSLWLAPAAATAHPAGAAWYPGGLSPIGALESVTTVGTQIRVTGWAIDQDVTGPVYVYVYVDNRTAGAASAYLNRPDIGAAYPAYGPNHGYDTTVFAGAGEHTVCVVAVNTGPPGFNSQLGCGRAIVGG